MTISNFHWISYFFRFIYRKCLLAYATSATARGILLAIVKMVVVEVVVAAAVASNYTIHIHYLCESQVIFSFVGWFIDGSRKKERESTKKLLPMENICY